MKCEHCEYCCGEDEKGHICRLAGCEARLSGYRVERCKNGIDADSGEKSKMMNKRKENKMIELLTVDNRERIENYLTEYMKEVLQEEEYLNTFEKCRLEAERVECFRGEHLTENHVENWLRGLPLEVSYITYNICKMLLRAIAVSEDDFFDRNIYKEKSYDLDCFYWETLAKIIMNN